MFCYSGIGLLRLFGRFEYQKNELYKK